jgi:hypothetical protein
VLLAFYKELIRIRKNVSPFSARGAGGVEVVEPGRGEALCVRRWDGHSHAFTAYNFSPAPVSFSCRIPEGLWRVVVDSGAAQWNGPGGSVPELLQSQGIVSLSLPASAFATYTKQ